MVFAIFGTHHVFVHGTIAPESKAPADIIEHCWAAGDHLSKCESWPQWCHGALGVP